MFHRRSASAHHHLSSHHFDRLRLYACFVSHSPIVESPNSATHQSRLVCAHEPRPYVSTVTLTHIITLLTQFPQHSSMLHSPHCSKLAKRQLRPDVGKRRQLVLAQLGGLHRHHRRLHSCASSRLQNRLFCRHFISFATIFAEV